MSTSDTDRLYAKLDRIESKLDGFNSRLVKIEMWQKWEYLFVRLVLGAVTVAVVGSIAHGLVAR